MTVTQEERLGRWVKAREESYYPTIWEKIGHLFGKHVYPYQEPFTCLMCGEEQPHIPGITTDKNHAPRRAK